MSKKIDYDAEFSSLTVQSKAELEQLFESGKLNYGESLSACHRYWGYITTEESKKLLGGHREYYFNEQYKDKLHRGIRPYDIKHYRRMVTTDIYLTPENAQSSLAMLMGGKITVYDVYKAVMKGRQLKCNTCGVLKDAVECFSSFEVSCKDCVRERSRKKKHIDIVISRKNNLSAKWQILADLPNTYNDILLKLKDENLTDGVKLALAYNMRKVVPNKATLKTMKGKNTLKLDSTKNDRTMFAVARMCGVCRDKLQYYSKLVDFMITSEDEAITILSELHADRINLTTAYEMASVGKRIKCAKCGKFKDAANYNPFGTKCLDCIQKKGADCPNRGKKTSDADFNAAYARLLGKTVTA